MGAKPSSEGPPRIFRGRIAEVRGLTVVAQGLPAALGELCWIGEGAQRVAAEVVGLLSGYRAYLMPYGDLHGVRVGTGVWTTGRRPTLVVGESVLGRVVDGNGLPLDGGPVLVGPRQGFDATPLSPLGRLPVTEVLSTGMRVVDGLCTLGRGQRVGFFAGAGVGKTTLLQMLLEGTASDVTVVALIGERGREVSQFCESLDPVTRRKTVVVASTSDMSALIRLRAAQAAMTLAEHFRSQGREVLLVMDSLTRVAMAQREVGLQAGEMASARGYTPSVFHMLPRLLERAGRTAEGSITGLYTVLLDSDDPSDPVGDAVRGILDGAIYLSRPLAEAHHYPAIDVGRSLSRSMGDIVSEEHWDLSRQVRQWWETLERSRDLVSLGAYQPGSDAEVDRALALAEPMRRWLDQARGERTPWEETLSSLAALLATTP